MDQRLKILGNQKKRKSKFIFYDRDYICGCGKIYFSYAALYTHLKQKHNGENISGISLPKKIRKTRGRPKKSEKIEEIRE